MGMVVLALFRDILRHPWQLILTILSITAGVSVIVGVDIANESAMTEFRRADQILSGNATHRLTGGTRNLDESIYRMVRVEAGIRAASPVIRTAVSIPGVEGTWTLLGVDPFADTRLREFHFGQQDGDDSSWPIYVSPDLSGFQDKRIVIDSGDRSQVFHWAGNLTIPGNRASRYLVTDIAWAQDFLDMQGLISYVDLRLNQAEESRLRLLLPGNVRLVDLGVHHQARVDMSRAFRINLTALGLLAMVVAMFLVYSAVSFQVMRRRKLLGLLGVLGVTVRQLNRILMAEIVSLGVVGTVLGIFLGSLLAEILTILVSGTITDLYHTLGDPVPILAPWTVFKALGVGIAGTLLAGWVPTWLISRKESITLLYELSEMSGRLRVAPLLLPCSLGLSSISFLLFLFSDVSLIFPFAGLFLLICSLSIIGPWLLYLGYRIARKLHSGKHILVWKMALGNAGCHLDRTGVAIAALSVALAAALGVELMIQSFRYSVENWLENYLRADVYISADSTTDRYLTDSLLEALRTMPLVLHLSTGRRVELVTHDGILKVLALDMPEEGFAGFRIIEGKESALWDRFHKEGQVLVSESLSRRMDLVPGSIVEIPTDQGLVPFLVAAVYQDYSSDQGLVTMDRATWDRYFVDDRQVSASLYLLPGSDPVEVIRSIRQHPVTPEGLFLRSNSELRQVFLEVFDETFQITSIVRWLAVTVAVIGILSALMSLLLERKREFALLTAVGFSRRQVSRILFVEAGYSGLVAGMVAIPLGMLLSLVLIHVINVQSFGWSMESRLDWNLTWQVVGLSVASSIAATLYPTSKVWNQEAISKAHDR